LATLLKRRITGFLWRKGILTPPGLRPSPSGDEREPVKPVHPF